MIRALLQGRLMVAPHCPLTCSCSLLIEQAPTIIVMTLPLLQGDGTRTCTRCTTPKLGLSASTGQLCRATCAAKCRLPVQASASGADLHLFVGGQGTVPGWFAGVHRPRAGDHGHGGWAADWGWWRPGCSTLSLQPWERCGQLSSLACEGVLPGVTEVCWACLRCCGGMETWGWGAGILIGKLNIQGYLPPFCHAQA